MAHIQDGHEVINIVKDGKLGNFHLAAQGYGTDIQPQEPSKVTSGEPSKMPPENPPNIKKDLRIYKQKRTVYEQGQVNNGSHQRMTPIRVVPPANAKRPTKHPQVITIDCPKQVQSMGYTTRNTIRKIVTLNPHLITTQPAVTSRHNTVHPHLITTQPAVTSSHNTMHPHLITTQPAVTSSHNTMHPHLITTQPAVATAVTSSFNTMHPHLITAQPSVATAVTSRFNTMHPHLITTGPAVTSSLNTMHPHLITTGPAVTSSLNTRHPHLITTRPAVATAVTSSLNTMHPHLITAQPAVTSSLNTMHPHLITAQTSVTSSLNTMHPHLITTRPAVATAVTSSLNTMHPHLITAQPAVTSSVNTMHPHLITAQTSVTSSLNTMHPHLITTRPSVTSSLNTIHPHLTTTQPALATAVTSSQNTIPKTHLGNMCLRKDFVATPLVGSISQSMVAVPQVGSISQNVVAMPQLGSISQNVVAMPQLRSIPQNVVALPQVGSISQSMVAMPQVGSISQNMVAIPQVGSISHGMIVMPQVGSISQNMVVKPLVQSISQNMIAKSQVWSVSQNLKHPNAFLPMSTVAFQLRGSQNPPQSSPIIRGVIPNECLSIGKQPRVAADSPTTFRVLETSDLDDDDDDDDDCGSLVDFDDIDSDDDKIETDLLKCPECDFHFSKEVDLIKHEKIHKGEMNYICEQCGLEFGIKRLFDLHVRTHEMEKKFECDFCHKKFDYRDNLIFHMRIHGGIKSFKCHICNKRFGNKSMRDNHMLQHPEPKMTFSGNWLVKGNQSQGRVAANSSQLGSALKVNQKAIVAGVSQQNSVAVLGTHKKNGPKNVGQHSLVKGTDQLSASNLQKSLIGANQNFKVVAEGSQADLSVYICHDCNKGFPDKVSLDNHMRSHEKVEVEPKARHGKGIKSEKKFTCPKCTKIYFNEHFYKCHLSLCYDDDDINKDFVNCAFCKKNYTLPKQVKDDNNQSVKFICEPCCTLLAQKSQVSGFMPRLENRFICNKCEMCFPNEEQLRTHLESHLKPYECSKCKKRFTTDKALQEHLECHFAEHLQSSFSNVKKKVVISHVSVGNKKVVVDSDNRGRKHSKVVKDIVKDSDSDKLNKTKFRKKSRPWKMDISPPRSSKCKVVKFSGREFGKRKRRRGRSRPSDDEESLQELEDLPTSINPERPGISSVRKSTKTIADLSFTVGKNRKLNDSQSAYEGMTDMGMEIKREDDDKSDHEGAGNITVFIPASFSSLSRREATTSFVCPDNAIKQEIDDSSYSDLPSTIKIKEENVSEDEITIKEEDPDIDPLGFTIKEEEMDDSENELLMHENFEFNSFGGSMEMENVLSS